MTPDHAAWFDRLQRQCEEGNAARRWLRERHPRRSNESAAAYLVRLCGILLRRDFPPRQGELFGDYAPGGVYDYQEAVVRQQSAGRAHRIGQKTTVTYIDLIAPDAMA